MASAAEAEEQHRSNTLDSRQSTYPDRRCKKSRSPETAKAKAKGSIPCSRAQTAEESDWSVSNRQVKG